MFSVSSSLVTIVLLQTLPAWGAKGGQCGGKRYAIMDNDWETLGFGPFLTVLDGGMDILALTSVTGDTWQPQCALHAVATLEIGNLSCIPVYEGALLPILNNMDRFSAWQAVHGRIPYQGVFATQNVTSEESGADPTGGEPGRINKAAFPEGFPKKLPNDSTNAANLMVELVKKHPGCVSIYGGGPLTNIALAVRMDPNFAKLAKELVVMGGYVDVNLLQATSTISRAQINSDTNILLDPEAAKIALTADFPTITISGNAAKQLITTQEFLDEIYEVKNPYTELAYHHYQVGFPFWDETAAAIMADPSIVTKQASVYLDVDTAYGSPSYGNIHVYQEAYAPPHAKKVNYVFEVDGDRLGKTIKHGMQHPKSCADFM